MSWQRYYEAGNRAFGGGLYSAALPSYLQALQSAQQSGDAQALADTQRGLARTYLELGQIEQAKLSALQAEEVDRSYWGYENAHVAEDMFLLAECWRRQDNYPQARELFERVLHLRASFFGEAHSDSLDVMVKLIVLDLQENSWETLLDHMRRATSIFSQLHPSGAFVKSLNLKTLLQVYIDQNRHQEADRIAQSVQQALRTVLGNAHPELTQALVDCSAVMKTANKHLSAWQFQTKAKILEGRNSDLALSSTREVTPPAQTDATTTTTSATPVPHMNLVVQTSTEENVRQNAHRIIDTFSHTDSVPVLAEASVEQLSDAGNRALASGLFDSAISYLLSALQTARRAGDDHAIADVLRKVATIFLELDRVEEARQAAEEAVKVDRKFWGIENQQVAEGMFLLAEAWRRQGKFAQAQELFTEVLSLRRVLFGNAHDECLQVLIRLIWCSVEEGNVEHTNLLIREAMALFSAIHPRGAFTHSLSIRALLRPYQAQNRHHEAEGIVTRILDAMRTVLGAQHPEVLHLIEDCSGVKKTSDNRWEQRDSTGVVATAVDETVGSASSSYQQWQPVTEQSPGSPAGRSSEYAAIGEPEAKTTIKREGLLREAVTLAGWQIDPQQLKLVWLGCSVCAGLASMFMYVTAGAYSLICEPFIVGFLISTLAAAICMAIGVIVHQKKLVSQIPDSLEIMVSLLQAGTPITEVLESLARTAPLPLRAEFARMVDRMTEGSTLKSALAELTYRVRAHELIVLSDAIRVSLDIRGHLAEQVATIAAASRNKQRERSSIGISNFRIQALILIASGIAISSALRFMFDPSYGVPILSLWPCRIFLYAGMFVVFALAPRLNEPSGRQLGKASAEKATFSSRLVEKCLVQFRKIQMQDRLRNEFSDFLDMVVMYVESGVSLPHAVHQVRNTATSSCPTLCKELEVYLAQLQSFKSSLPKAFKALGEKYDVNELLILGGTIAAAEQINSGVAYQLREQSKFVRLQLQRKRQARAAAAFSIVVGIGVACALLIHILETVFAGH